MHKLLIAGLLLTPPALFAADDLTVLKTAPGSTPPHKRLRAFQLAECQKHFDARKAEVEQLKTPADIAARQERLRKSFIAALGGFPEKTPLNARSTGSLKRNGYRIEKVIYESRPDHHVTANLYIPDGPGPFPGVLMPLGHSLTGKAAEYMQRGAVLLVKNGFVALVYDPIGQGERMQVLDKLGQPAIKGSTSEHTMCGIGALLEGRCTASFRIWDGIRSLDYLASRPEVDAKKLGCTGCSGGGTLTSYLMALDDRIQAAAPSCYLTTLERLFATIGPQDGEQNIPGQVAFGLDHADYIFLRAPKPTLILASTFDFFDNQGTWTTFREAKRIYGLLDLPERIDLAQSDTKHGYPKLQREAMARFMSRWLKGKNAVIVEADFPIEKESDLWCTRTGQVIEDLKGKSVFDLNAERAAELAKTRAAHPLDRAALRAEAARFIGLPEKIAAAQMTEGEALARDGYTIRKIAFTTEADFPVPGLLFQADQTKPTSPLVVYIHDGGKAATVDAAKRLAKGGRRVLAVDLRGFGETAPGTAPAGKPNFFGVEQGDSFIGMHRNRPLLGQRVYDLLAVIRAADPDAKGVEVIGIGSAAPVVLHAAALDERIKAATLEHGVLSWDAVARTPISENQLSNVVPGVLTVYDLPDLAAAMAPRPLTIRNPADATGKPAAREDIDAAYRPVRAAYEKANAAEKLNILVK